MSKQSCLFDALTNLQSSLNYLIDERNFDDARHLLALIEAVGRLVPPGNDAISFAQAKKPFDNATR